MKKIIALFALCCIITLAFAQKDTTIIYNGNRIVITEDHDDVSIFVEKLNPDSIPYDSIPPRIVDEFLNDPFENDSLDDNKNQFFGDRFLNPDFSERVQKNFKRRHYQAHISGFFLGFSNLSSRKLNIGNVPNAVLKYSSYEIGWTMFSKDFRLTKPYRNYALLLGAGLGFRYNQYNADLNTAFRQINGQTIQTNAPIGIQYTESFLSVWYIHVPLVLEWQKKSRHSNFYVQIGAEGALKISGKSKIIYNPDDDREIYETIGKNLNINPLMVDAKLQVGFNNVSLYAKYGVITFFRNNRGAHVIPVSAGINLHF